MKKVDTKENMVMEGIFDRIMRSKGLSSIAEEKAKLEKEEKEN